VSEAVFVLLEPPSPSRRIFIGSHSLPPLWFAVSVLQIEQKIDMVQCNDRDKVLLASGQLVGATSEWWNSYIDERGQPQSNVWKEFKDNFISHFIHVSVIKLKRKEFLSLKQGQMTVTKYGDKFI
jgi:hypothetical protein